MATVINVSLLVDELTNIICNSYGMLMEKLARFKKIVIVDTAGISSMYANDGGIIIAV